MCNSTRKDKHTDDLPPIWGDNSNLRRGPDDCPPIDEEALYKRVLDSEATLRELCPKVGDSVIRRRFEVA